MKVYVCVITKKNDHIDRYDMLYENMDDHGSAMDKSIDITYILV